MLRKAFNKPHPAKTTSNGVMKLDEDITLEVFLYQTTEDIENAQIAGATYL
jgi:hypothetical protein